MRHITLSLAAVTAATCAIASAQELSEHDRVHVAVQEICPVSGQKLGAHGTPMKVKVGQEVVFFCCKACLKGQVDRQHWATIHANFATAQRFCPVMKKELPKNPKWTIIDGQIVYVCCPPCTEKIAAEPKRFLQEIDKLYSAALERKSTLR